VTPSYKGCKENLGNYGLVNLTLVPGKVMEEIRLVKQDLSFMDPR